MAEQVDALIESLISIRESVCAGKKAMKPWRTPEGPKKFAVCVGGKVVRFGDPNLEIKRDSASRRKNFRARHGCGKRPNTKDPKKAGYWACKTWEKKRTVGDVVEQRKFRLLERKDQIPGGLADKSDPSEFDSNQLAMGKKVEREHTNSDERATEIAMDHLKENPRYYSLLKKIEPHHESVRGQGDPGMGGPPHSGGHPIGSPSYHGSRDWRRRASTMRPGKPAPHVGWSKPAGRTYSNAANWEKPPRNKARRKEGKRDTQSAAHEYLLQRHQDQERPPLNLVGESLRRSRLRLV
jgi:hypothetical protein